MATSRKTGGQNYSSKPPADFWPTEVAREAMDILQSSGPSIQCPLIYTLSLASADMVSCTCCWCLAKSGWTLLQPCWLQPARLLCPSDSPGKNTGVGCHVLLQGIFPTQGLNLWHLYWQEATLPLSHQEKSFLPLFCFFNDVIYMNYCVWGLWVWFLALSIMYHRLLHFAVFISSLFPFFAE